VGAIRKPIFSGLGLLLSLMFLTYGIDLCPGFF
jgi:hypothetical protein